MAAVGMGGSDSRAAEPAGVSALPAVQVSACIGPAPVYDLVAEYRRGAPLREIELSSGLGLEILCRELAYRHSSGPLHLQRSRAVRRAVQKAQKSIIDNLWLIHQLSDTDITPREIPTVLQALGRIKDVDYVGDLLEYPGPPMDGILRTEPPRPTAADRISLLYVTGIHHGIAPDHQLALAKISPETVAGFRQLFPDSFSYRRFADFLAVAETTALAIRARKVTHLSYADYVSCADTIRRRLGAITLDDAAPWPVPGPDLRRRLGDTYWDDAVRRAGLKIMHSQDLFHHDDFVDALDAFVEEATDMKLPFTLGSYDTWYIVEQACSQNRPSAVEVIQRFGTWESALRLVGGPPEEKEDGTRICPVCGKEAWPIVLGMWCPDPDNPNPKVIHTGCVVTPETPKHRWQCMNQSCGFEWS